MSSLSDALKSKQETNASEGSEKAEQAASSSLDWEEVGRRAEQKDAEERPRRQQTNVDLPEDLKRRFKAQLEADNLQMRFVIEDLIRVYVDHME